MKTFLYIITLLSISAYSQNTIELFVNKVASDIITKDLSFYNLTEKSLDNQTSNGLIELTKEEKNKTIKSYPNFPFQLLQKIQNEQINWRDYHLEKVKFISERTDEVYYQFSNPIFTEDNQYARISVLQMRKNGGTCTAYIYENRNGAWSELFESDQYYVKIGISH